MNTRIRTRFIGLLLCLLQANLWGSVGGVVGLPLAGKRTPENNSGLQISVDCTWVEASGHRPVTIDVVCVPPPTADRNLRIVLEPADWTGTRSGVAFDLTIPEKTVRVSKQVAIPQQSNWHQIRISVNEDGRELKDVSCQFGLPRTSSNYEWTEAYPAILFIDKDAPTTAEIMSGVAAGNARNETKLVDVMAFAEFIPPFDDYAQNLWRTLPVENGKRKRTFDDVILTALPRLMTFELRRVNDLPKDRISYSAIDVFVLDLADLKTLVSTQPEAWRAIQDHLFSGTTMIVYGLDDLTALTGELDELLAMPGLATPEWLRPDDDRFGATAGQHFHRETVAQNFNSGYYAEDVDVFDDDPAETQRRRDEPVPEPVFRRRAYGGGRVVALGVKDVSDASSKQMGWMVADCGHVNWRWYHRHGLSKRRLNSGFWDFLIPGVGAAPVKTFVAIITCFMILIGPVNYFLLRRLNRLYLLLVTVPFGAALITASLYGYALLKDGMGTRLRARSFSEQVADGRLISYSRQTYYAGLAPSSGLQFPNSSIFFPVHYDPTDTQGSRRLVNLEEQERQFTTGYLRSRVAAQGLVVNHCEGGLVDVVASPDNGGAPQIKNGLNVDIDYAIVYDNGEAFLSSRIAAGKTVAPAAIDLAEAQKKLLTDLAEFRPAQPVGFTPPRRSRRNSWYYNQRVDQGFAKPSFSTSMLESGIGDVIDDLSPSRKNKTGRFCVVVTKKIHDYVPVGIEGSQEIGGVHILRLGW